MGKKINNLGCIVLVVMLLFSTGCSIKKMAMNQVAGVLTGPGSSTVFTGDNDPDLVGDALPFAIKMYESLLASLPKHRGLQLQTGSLYIMYANAFIQTPAELLPEGRDEDQEYLLARAKNLYLRGRDILMNGLEKRYPGFIAKMEAKKYNEALSPINKKEISLLYWAAAGWLGAFAIDPFDMKLGMTIPGAKAMMEKVAQMDPNYENGEIDAFYVLYYGAMPDYMGGDFKKARVHYKRALEASGGRNTSVHLSLATTVCVQKQNIDEFKKLLNIVMNTDPDSDPENRLVNTINRRKAKWLLAHVEDYFLDAGSDEPVLQEESGEETDDADELSEDQLNTGEDQEEESYDE